MQSSFSSYSFSKERMQGPLNSQVLLCIQKRACHKKADKLSVPKSSKLEIKLAVGDYKYVGGGEP